MPQATGLQFSAINGGLPSNSPSVVGFDLTNNFSADGSVFLLLEEGRKQWVRRTLYEKDEAPLWLPLFAGTSWQPLLEQSPLLVESPLHSPFCRWALDTLQQRPNDLRGLVIESMEGLQAVTNWAQQGMNVTFEGQRRGLLRFYDPLIWHALLPRQLDHPQPVAAVHYWHQMPGESQGQWYTSACPEPVTVATDVTLRPEQLESLRQLDRMLHHASVNHG